MRTEQETRLEKALFDLIDNAGSMLNVEFVDSHSSYRNQREEKQKSVAIKKQGFVQLILVEPTSQLELDEWAQAIVRAEVFVGLIEEERIYDNNHPNYFLSILSKFRNLKK